MFFELLGLMGPGVKIRFIFGYKMINLVAMINFKFNFRDAQKLPTQNLNFFFYIYFKEN